MTTERHGLRADLTKQCCYCHPDGPLQPQALAQPRGRCHHSWEILCGESKLLPFAQEVSAPGEGQGKETGIENRAQKQEGGLQFLRYKEGLTWQKELCHRIGDDWQQAASSANKRSALFCASGLQQSFRKMSCCCKLNANYKQCAGHSPEAGSPKSTINK